MPKRSYPSCHHLLPTDGWAVGSDGCIIRWDGDSWSNVTSPTAASLSCVNMVSSTDGWTVGADGNIYRWQEQVAPFPAEYLAIIIAVIVVFVIVILVYWKKRKR